MEIKIKKLSSSIYLLKFRTKKDMAHTFLRFQENYESPEFMGKIFTHKEYFRWYKTIKNSRYHEDWEGFNLPSSAFEPFMKGKFNPLTRNEIKLLSLFKGIKGDFYIIAFHGNGHHLLGHELAHAVYAINKSYRNKVKKIIRKYDVGHIKKELLKMGGYSKNVLDDEIQAYTISLNHELQSEFPKKLSQEINNLFVKYGPNILNLI